MSTERRNMLHSSEVRTGRYLLEIKTFEYISAGSDVFFDLGTSAYLKGCSGHCPPIEEYVKEHKISFYGNSKHFGQDRDALNESAEEFHKEQTEKIKNLSFEKLRMFIQWEFKDRDRVMALAEHADMMIGDILQQSRYGSEF